MPDTFTTLFDPSSIFAPEELDTPRGAHEVITVPIGSTNDVGQVELGTAVVILVCFIYLAYKSFKTATRINAKSSHIKNE